MQDNRGKQFPDINFVDTDTERLVSSMISAYELFTGRTLFPADPVRLFILWIADIIMQERVIIDRAAKQNVPRYAEGAFLDSLAEIFKDTQRLQAQPARTAFRFFISAPQLSAQTVPAGTRVAVDGTIIFETTEAAIVPPGQLYTDAPAVCLTAGAAGNGFAPGQITQIMDLFTFFERVENTTETEGGIDTENDVQFYERLRGSMESFSTAGSIGAYIYWVKTASQQIVDVMPTSPSPGVVDIRVLLENGEYPGAEMIQLIFNTLNGRVPMTDYIKINPPDPRPFDIDLVFFLPRTQEVSTETAEANVKRAIDEYKQWQTERMGRDINPDKLTKLLLLAGAKRAEIAAPMFAVVNKNEVAALRNCNVVFGGLENE
jgi:phage-related baseplate assembly protein